MSDQHARFYLVTTEWRSFGRYSSTGGWHRQNHRVAGCPGLWWAHAVRARRLSENNHRAKCQEWEEANPGKPLPMSEQQSPEEHAFVGAVEITREGYEALEGVFEE